MTQEEKSLLLKDLCARVPYHPKGHIVNACTGAKCDEWLTCATFSMFTSVTNNCRLYLRPMSSMTEEEREVLRNIDDFIEIIVDFNHICGGFETFDYLNSIHVDYRKTSAGKTMIEAGLALEAPEGMYNLNKE